MDPVSPRSEAASLDRKVQPAIAALLTAVLLALGAVAPVAAAARVPKVALIVGPVGDLTSRYRSLANEAAAVARDAGAQVVKVYSPDATWPAVRQALDGASIVIYLGHGNGWPSRYRDSLYPPSQNGFGLNPVAGVDDRSHQYFGEARVDDVRLARNAVVLLHHLCYASGNTEPGLPEGTLAQAKQRVDNYAAGFIRAGAKAVVAEAHMGPAWYVRQLLSTNDSIERIWNRSPNANGNVIRAASERSRGFTARLDPDHASSGFYRSLVSRGVSAGDLRSGASGTRSGSAGGSVSEALAGPPPVPTLARTALRFGTLQLGAMPIASTKTKVTIPVAAGAPSAIPKGAQVSLRWDPILLDAPLEPATPPPGPSTTPDPSAAPAASASPGAIASTAPGASSDPAASPDASAAPVASATPTPTPSPSPTPSPTPAPARTAPPAPASTPTTVHGLFALPTKEPASDPGAAPEASPEASPEAIVPVEAPSVDLVVPEVQGSVVEPVKVERSKSGIWVPTTFPKAPGLYRLVPTLHTPSGVAYDAATQALLTPVIVRIGGEIAVAYGAPASLSLPAGMQVDVPVRVLNSGSQPWDVSVTLQPGEAGQSSYSTSQFPAVLTGTWVSTTAAPVPDAISVELDASIAGPGGAVAVALGITAPSAPGEYLLLLDTISPSHGPLSALGSAPAIVRVTVTQAVASPTPIPPQRQD